MDEPINYSHMSGKKLHSHKGDAGVPMYATATYLYVNELGTEIPTNCKEKVLLATCGIWKTKLCTYLGIIHKPKLYCAGNVKIDLTILFLVRS